MNMITNLFNIFDPASAIFNLKLNWFRMIFIIFFIPNSFWITPARLEFLIYKLNFNLNKELKISINFYNNKNYIIFFSLFYIIILNNLIGIFPYIFTRTTHLTFSLILSISTWLSFIIFGWINNTFNIIIHLVPQGTPTLLIIFIVLIELIRNIIRPITLSIRLTANLISGHLLIVLLGDSIIKFNIIIIIIIIIVQIILFTIERAIAIIQSYVFTILRTLYSNESF